MMIWKNKLLQCSQIIEFVMKVGLQFLQYKIDDLFTKYSMNNSLVYYSYKNHLNIYIVSLILLRSHLKT